MIINGDLKDCFIDQPAKKLVKVILSKKQQYKDIHTEKVKTISEIFKTLNDAAKILIEDCENSNSRKSHPLGIY